MIFSDLFFIFAFLPVFFLLYMAAAAADRPLGSGNLLKNIVLVIFSLIFYAWGEPVYVFLMIGSSLLNYVAGLLIDKHDGRGRKTALVLGVAVNLVVLGVFKYLGFFASILVNCGLNVPVPHIALPIGISFYTFQSISYLADVYRRESPAQRSYLGLLLYISMFPQLVAGPIVRYGTVADEIQNRHVSASDIADGSYRFLIGLAKKVIFANQLSEISDQFLVNGLNDLTTTGAWLGVVAFTLQIYFDFSGYSDMAIGLGRMLGFHFNENFDHPYVSRSITEFWRRWHMSLGSFFRDYVYIPMGGNRRHQMWNIFWVWFLTGMWHGASWNFIFWGLFYCVLLINEKAYLYRLLQRIPRVFCHVYCIVLTVVGMGIFYFDDLHKMGHFFGCFFGPQASQFHSFATTSGVMDNFWLWTAAIVLATPVRNFTAGLLRKRFAETRPTVYGAVATGSKVVVSVALLVVCAALLVGATNNAFIYTRF